MLGIKCFSYRAQFFNALMILSAYCVNSANAENYNFVDVNAYPLGFYDDKRQVKGVAIDIFKRVMNNLGHQTNLELLPGKRVIYLLKEGKAHGVPFIRKTDNRQQFLDYSSEIIFSENIYLYVNIGSSFSFNGKIEVLKGQRIAVVLGDSHGDEFNNLAYSLDITETSSLASSFKMLEKNRVDIVLSTSIRASRELKNPRDVKIIKLSTPLVIAPLYAAFSKKQNLTELRNEFDKELIKLKASGEVDRIITQWH